MHEDANACSCYKLARALGLVQTSSVIRVGMYRLADIFIDFVFITSLLFQTEIQKIHMEMQRGEAKAPAAAGPALISDG